MVFALWLVVVASALSVVYVTYLNRQSTQELESLRHSAGELQVRSGQYLLERSTLATYSRVGRLAEEKLGMTTPDIKQVVLIKP